MQIMRVLILHMHPCLNDNVNFFINNMFTCNSPGWGKKSASYPQLKTRSLLMQP